MTRTLRKRTDEGLNRLKPYLDEICREVETIDFISNDPVLFMHSFEEKKDREIAGFLAALFAWGQRKVVLKKTEELMKRIDYQPFAFVHAYQPVDSKYFKGFRHRTFNQEDLHGLFSALQIVYNEWSDFESFWRSCQSDSARTGRHIFTTFRSRFYSLTPELRARTRRHLPDPSRNSSCKRISMFYRWCNRTGSPVDPGIWNLDPNSNLVIPMDVHVARQSRRIGLLTRKSTDWKAVCELTDRLKKLDPVDPSRYDFALFGLGALGYRLPTHFMLNRQP
jgi:uncharacterized protein (TIGR02757 family)